MTDTFQRYLDEGYTAINLHPDYPGGVDYETAASDMIASILHAIFDNPEYKPEDYETPDELLAHALCCYHGDQEER